MERVYQVQTTTDSREGAEELARAVVDRRLAACVQITGPLQSVYRWEDAIQVDEEWLLACKTTKSLSVKLQEAITELHSYDVPEILMFTVEAGLDSYISWVAEETGQAPEGSAH